MQQPLCKKCNDQGFYYLDVPVGHLEFGKVKFCQCRCEQVIAAKREKLERLDGLTEEERLIRFADYMQTDGNRNAFEQVRLAQARSKGIVLLQGPYGIGKSRLLIAAVNESRNEGTPAVYSSMAEILDYLRDAFSPKRDAENYEERWELLLSAPVLAIDELEKFSATPWAMEKFTQLLHARYRNLARQLTLMATNATVDALPGDLRSRLGDGRTMVISMRGQDLRPLNEW